MADAKVQIVVNVQFGDGFKLIEEYLCQLPEDEVEPQRKVLEEFVYWILKNDMKKARHE